MSALSETFIVAALRRGNLRRAAELLLETYEEEVFRYCARLTGMAEAIPIYQRVLEQCMASLASFDNRTSIRAWLFRLARHLTLERHRQTPCDHPDAAPALTFSAPGSPSTRSVDLEPAVRPLDLLFSNLPLPAVEILQLALWHGLSISEISYVVGREESRVRRLASEGLSTLDIELQRRSGTPS
jgi:RNA polymerase sigma factor (sigma-70 family)